MQTPVGWTDHDVETLPYHRLEFNVSCEDDTRLNYSIDLDLSYNSVGLLKILPLPLEVPLVPRFFHERL